MHNFEYHNPTRIVFGKNEEDRIGSILKDADIKKVLLVYGGGSIKRSGLYDKVKNSLGIAGIQVQEYAGIKPNPRVSDVDKAAQSARDFGAQAVLAVGGGSVIDSSKAIAAAAKMNRPVWDFYTGTAISDALPIYTIVTLAATASEMNAGFVLTNEETGEKLGNWGACLFPKVSILNPENTFTVPADYTAYGAVDICAHVLEAYFTGDNDPWLMNTFVEGIIKTVIRSTEVILKEPDNYKARAEFMWAATMGLNSTTSNGVSNVSFPNHMIEHGLSAVTDIAHGAGLSIIIPAWSRWYYKNNPAQFEHFANEVFDLDTAEAGIDALENWFKKIGSPVRLSEAGIQADQIDVIAEKAFAQGAAWGMQDYYSIDVIKEILKTAL